MSGESDRDRIWELQQRIKNLAGTMPLSSPPILALAEELDRIVNRIMGIAGTNQTNSRTDTNSKAPR